MPVAIKVENLGKIYHVRSGSSSRSSTLRDRLEESFRGMMKRAESPLSYESIWAVKDVSLAIEQGEKVGILGSNGAGKSTLLKLLTQITEPTTGRIGIRGQVASLLEVGTGFHSELTGRENVYLNGATLGMHRSEIRKKFDAIVEFAEVANFIDTPVKRYSSGMVLRLAFSVAAHLEAQIVLIDEVLAVGDNLFQQKCIRKMSEVAESGRTILFVSHNMNTIGQLCDRGILMDHGQVRHDGEITSVISHYLTQNQASADLSLRTDRLGNGIARAQSITFLDEFDRPTDTISAGKPVRLAVDVKLKREAYNHTLAIQLAVSDIYDNYLISLGTDLLGPIHSPNHELVRYVGELKDGLPLTPAHYNMYLAVYCNGRADKIRRAFPFEVVASDFWDAEQFPDLKAGPILVRQKWEVRNLPSI